MHHGFNQHYGYSPFGEYKGFLDNGGESIEMKWYEQDLYQMTYDDRVPWPVVADGEGYSMVPVMLNPTADPNDPHYWRASIYVGGSPGRDDILITATADMTKQNNLYQNFPNPFKGITSLSYSLTASTFVEIKIFDSHGRELESLINEYQLPGKYEIQYSPKKNVSGLLFFKLISNGYSSEMKRMIYLE